MWESRSRAWFIVDRGIPSCRACTAHHRTYRFIFICFTTSPFTIPTISYATRSPLLSPTYHTSIQYTVPILTALFSILFDSLLTHRTSHCPIRAGALTVRSYTIRQTRQYIVCNRRRLVSPDQSRPTIERSHHSSGFSSLIRLQLSWLCDSMPLPSPCAPLRPTFRSISLHPVFVSRAHARSSV